MSAPGFHRPITAPDLSGEGQHSRGSERGSHTLRSHGFLSSDPRQLLGIGKDCLFPYRIFCTLGAIPFPLRMSKKDSRSFWGRKRGNSMQTSFQALSLQDFGGSAGPWGATPRASGSAAPLGSVQTASTAERARAASLRVQPPGSRLRCAPGSEYFLRVPAHSLSRSARKRSLPFTSHSSFPWTIPVHSQLLQTWVRSRTDTLKL